MKLVDDDRDTQFGPANSWGRIRFLVFGGEAKKGCCALPKIDKIRIVDQSKRTQVSASSANCKMSGT